MELAFGKDELFKSIQILQGVAAGRNALPILSNVLVRAADNRIEMSATDLEVGIKIVVAGTIFEEGAITVSARKLGEVVRELPLEEVKFRTTENNRVEITCGAGVYKIIGLSHDEFPEVESIRGDFFTVEAEVLKSMIDKTEFSASTEETRYFMNGLYLHLTSEKSEVVGTDARRLAVASSEALIPPSQEPIGIILPLKAVREIMRTFEASTEVKISVLDNQIVFADDEFTLTSRLIDGEYPKYEQIIPKNHEDRITVDVEKLLSAARRVALLANPKTFSIRLDIQADQIEVSAKAPDLGEAYETVAINSGNGSLEVAFDARFFIDALSHIGTEEVVIEFKDSLSAAVLKPVGEDNHLCLIMPMRLES
jgi:DNA polymerase-3 subunit beta